MSLLLSCFFNQRWPLMNSQIFLTKLVLSFKFGFLLDFLPPHFPNCWKLSWDLSSTWLLSFPDGSHSFNTMDVATIPSCCCLATEKVLKWEIQSKSVRFMHSKHHTNVKNKKIAISYIFSKYQLLHRAPQLWD